MLMITSPGILEANAQGGCLAEVFPEFDNPDAFVPIVNLLENVISPVGAAIVNKDYLVFS